MLGKRISSLRWQNFQKDKEIMYKFLRIGSLIFVVSFFVLVSEDISLVYAVGDGTAFSEVGTTLQDTLQKASKGPIGQGLFYVAFIFGIFYAIGYNMFFNVKRGSLTRGFFWLPLLIAILFGIFIGSFSGISETLWNLFAK